MLYCNAISTLTADSSFVNVADVGGIYNDRWIQAVTRWVTTVYGTPSRSLGPGINHVEMRLKFRRIFGPPLLGGLRKGNIYETTGEQRCPALAAAYCSCPLAQRPYSYRLRRWDYIL